MSNRQLSTEQWIEKAILAHGDKYDYSKSVYTKSSNRITVTCPDHGDFSLIATTHTNAKKRGCPTCARGAGKTGFKLTTEEWITRATLRHGDTYDYSCSKYLGATKPIDIVCRQHGVFTQRGSDHLAGSGCSKCAGTYRYSTEEWIAKANEVHGGFYSYPNCVYVRNTDEVLIECPEHGEFSQGASVHLRGSGCPLCVGKSSSRSAEAFFSKCIEKFRGKFDYSQSVYTGALEPLSIICPEHGTVVFPQAAHHFHSLSGCGACSGVRNTKDFISKAISIHGDRYDYSLVDYERTESPVLIKCEKHGVFSQKPAYHLGGSNCPKCSVRFVDTELFIEQSREIHGSTYDYELTEYVDVDTPVIIKCPEHGEFSLTPRNHKGNKSGCPTCQSNTPYCVYLLEVSGGGTSGLFKIGISTDPMRRAKALTSKSSLGLSFVLLGASSFMEYRSAREWEHSLHSRFASARSFGTSSIFDGSTEIFDLEPTEVQYVLDTLK